MRHRKAGVKLNRSSSHRNAMFRNMVTSLFKHDRIKTTDTRAKELSRWADHIITLAKRGDLHARRQAMAIIREKDVVHKIFEEAQERFGKRNGGYTRVVKLGCRPGDAALISVIELISEDDRPKKKKKKAKAAPKKAEPAKKAATADVAEPTEVTPAPETDRQADADGETAEPESSVEKAVEAAPAEQKETGAKEPVEASPETDSEAGKKEGDKKSD